MAEDNKTNSSQTKETNSKTATTKSAASKSTTDTKAKTTASKKDDDKALALSVQPKMMLPQNRPIEPSHIDIVHTYSSVGSNRPVSKGTVEFSSSLAISGSRPIAASTLQISDSYVMGNRPVASNESDDTATLMGYLD